MKWDHVKDFVLHGAGGDASTVRDGLAAQVVSVTDPMHAVRQLDLRLETSGQLVTPMAALLFSRPGAPSSASAAPDVATARSGLRNYVFQHTLDSSGIGRLCDHIAMTEAGDDDMSLSGHRQFRASVMSAISEPLGGSINKAARLSSKGTILLANLIDPDHPSASRIRAHEAEQSSRFRYASADRSLSQISLGMVAERRLIVDTGHSDLTRQTSSLRDLAEIFSYGPYSADRERAYEARLQISISTQPNDGELPARPGYVRGGDDREDVGLQVADVASGWARTLIASHGYSRLANVFRCVIYNGALLQLDSAIRIDEDIRQHRRIVGALLKAA